MHIRNWKIRCALWVRRAQLTERMLDNSEDRSCASDPLSFLTHTATICCAATGSACYQWKLFPLHCFHFCKRLGGRDGYFPFILTAGSRWTQIGNVIKSYASKWHSICLCMLNSAPGFSSRSALFSLLSSSVNIFSLLCFELFAIRVWVSSY